MRNTDNEPDDWEIGVMEKFASLQMAGRDPARLETAEVVPAAGGGSVLRYAKAIPMDTLCLTCHGEDIIAPVKATVESLYPGDQATGFKEGELRGMFTVEFPLGKGDADRAPGAWAIIGAATNGLDDGKAVAPERLPIGKRKHEIIDETACSLLAVTLLVGCSSVPVTPASISALPNRIEDREAAARCLHEAVQISNAFLASSFNESLPNGQMTLSDDGIIFSGGGDAFPFTITCSVAGDILIPFRMAAQERACGFVVGSVRPHEHREIDNSLFRHTSGEVLPNHLVAGTLLHELAHCCHKVGTVSPTKTVRYCIWRRYSFCGIATIPWNACRSGHPANSPFS